MSLSRLASLLPARECDGSDRSIAQRIAGAAFLIRVVSAAIIFLTQVLLARWIGRFEFGVYVYVLAWGGVLGVIAPLGVAYSAQRFIPEYRTRGNAAGLRGFLHGGRWLCFGLGTAVAAMVAAFDYLAGDSIAAHYRLPFMIAALTMPMFTLSAVQDSIARSFNWIDLALVPAYVVQSLVILVVMAGLYAFGGPLSAVSALWTTCGAVWATTLLQLALLNRRLAGEVRPGARHYEIAAWLKTSLPIFLVDSFFLLLIYVDILVLQFFVGADEVAVYHAATKTLALINFIYFAVAAASAHRFSEYHIAGDRAKLAAFVADTTRWTFWPSLALGIVMLALGWPILMLFGPDFTEGYPLLFIMLVGLLARASVGPSERLLNMTGEQPVCALVYASAFAINLILCLVLIPRFELVGAAFATTIAVIVESTLLFVAAKRRLGLHVFVWGRRESE
jgi:O-antigen/teichoic acid export membrane protein